MKRKCRHHTSLVAPYKTPITDLFRDKILTPLTPEEHLKRKKNNKKKQLKKLAKKSRQKNRKK